MTADSCLKRWTLFETKRIGIYLSHYTDDQDWMHDHGSGFRFISIGLRGGYIERTPAGEEIFRAPWIRSFGGAHVHDIKMIDGGTCWTLLIIVPEWAE